MKNCNCVNNHHHGPVPVPATGGIINGLVPFAAFTNYTPVIPKFYYDVYDLEEREKHMAAWLQKLGCYSNYLADEIQELKNVTPIDFSEIEYTDPVPVEITSAYNTVVHAYMTNVKIRRDQVRLRAVTYEDMAPYNHDVNEYVYAQKPFMLFNMMAPGAGNYVQDGRAFEYADYARFMFMGYFGFDAEGNPMYVYDYDHVYSASKLAEMGFWNACATFYMLKENGDAIDPRELPYRGEDNALDLPNPRIAFGWDDECYYYHIVDGRLAYAPGTTDMQNMTLAAVEWSEPNIVLVGGGGDNQLWMHKPITQNVLTFSPYLDYNETWSTVDNVRTKRYMLEIIPTKKEVCQ